MRIAIVQDTKGMWFVRSLTYSHEDVAAGEMIYRCDKHLAGPFYEPIDAAHWVGDNVDEEETEIAEEGLIMLGVEEFEKLYADVELTFSSYYKYVFTFEGIAPDGVRIIAELGGNSDDIYREKINNNQKRKVGPHKIIWLKMRAWRGDDLIFDHNEY